MLTVVNFNMHAGIDGWGRPFDVIAACAAFEADVLVLQEAWTNDADGPGSGQAEQIAAALGYEVVTCTLAKGRRARPHPAATERWMPRLGFRASGARSTSVRARAFHTTELASTRYQQGDSGTWGIAVLTRRGMTVERNTHVAPPAPRP